MFGQIFWIFLKPQSEVQTLVPAPTDPGQDLQMRFRFQKLNLTRDSDALEALVYRHLVDRQEL